jgi:hypothetical protein
MEAAQQPAKRISVGDVVGETFSIYGQNAVALIGSAAAVFVIIGLAAGLLRNSGGLVLGVLAEIVSLIGYAIYVGFVVRLVQDVRDGRRDNSVGDLFSAATPAILPLIVFGILFAVGVTIGLILLVIPGLILLTFWSVGAPAIVIEEEGVVGAFGRSWGLVRGQAWSVFLTLLVILVIVLAIQFIFAAIANPIGNGDVATLVAAIISTVITAPVFAIAVSVLFFDLGGGGGGGDAAQVAGPSTAG